MFVLTMSSQYTPPQCIPASPACFFPPTAQLPPLTADVEYCLRHLRGDIHLNGAVLHPLDHLARVEQEVGQGRVEELPFLGIHREVSNLDAFCMSLRIVHEDEAAVTSRERLSPLPRSPLPCSPLPRSPFPRSHRGRLKKKRAGQK